MSPSRATGQRPAALLRLRALCLLAAMAFLSFPSEGLAQDITLTNLVLDNAEGKISVRFGVEFAEPFAIQAALSQGQELSFSATARLAAKRDYWFDRDAARGELLAPIRKEADETFVISLAGKEYRGRDFSTLLAKTFEDVSLRLNQFAPLTRGGAYSLTVDIRLLRTNVPDWLKGTLFFWTFEAVSPARYRLDFTY